jgi:IS5 family transposase
MDKQMTLSALTDELAQARTRKKEFLKQKVEHVFGIVKGLFGYYRKTRYKGRRKQEAKLHMQFALANLILADWRCLAV